MSLSKAEITKRFEPSRFVFENNPRRREKRRQLVRFAEDSSSESLFSDSETAPTKYSRSKSPKALSRCWGSVVVVGLLSLASGLTWHHRDALIPTPIPTASEVATNPISTPFTTEFSSPSTLLTNVQDATNTISTPSTTGFSSSSTLLTNAQDATNTTSMLSTTEFSSPSTLLTNLQDFASEESGGAIYCELTTGCSSWIPKLWNRPTLTLSAKSDPSQCWRVYSHKAQLGIVLSRAIYPHRVVVEHLSSEGAETLDAPRQMMLWGVVDGDANLVRRQKLVAQETSPTSPPPGPLLSGHHKFLPLARFEYNISQSDSQTFGVDSLITQSNIDFGIIVLEVLSNWGSQDICLCSVKIYGVAS